METRSQRIIKLINEAMTNEPHREETPLDLVINAYAAVCDVLDDIFDMLMMDRLLLRESNNLQKYSKKLSNLDKTLKYLNHVLNAYEKSKENQPWIDIDSEDIELLLDHIPRFRKYDQPLLIVVGENTELENKVEELFQEFMTKSKRLVPILQKLRSSIQDFDYWFNK
ncbi:hypothetical protein R80B4_01684 [Fibrobacteres bacterium R8-0-B4]